MNPPGHIEDEKRLRRYVLGQMADDEAQLFEEGAMSADKKSFDEADNKAEVVREKLIEDHASGRLTHDDKIAYSTVLQRSPEVRKEELVVGALLDLGKRHDQKVLWWERSSLWMQPLLQPAALVASLVLVSLVGVLGLRVVQLTGSQDSLQSQLDQARQLSTQIAGELEAASTRLLDLEASLERIRSQGILALASFILKPGLQRDGGEITRVSISTGRRLVELKLDLGLAEHQTYRVELYDSGGDEVLVQAGLRATSAGNDVYVILQLPTEILLGDDYQIRLSGVTSRRGDEMIDRYYFRVSRQ